MVHIFLRLEIGDAPSTALEGSECQVEASTTLRPNYDLKLFAFPIIRRSEVVRHYYESLTYVDLTKKQEKTKTYREGEMSFNAELF